MKPHCNFVLKPSRSQGFWSVSGMKEPRDSQGEVSNLWSCTTLGDGLNHVEADVALGSETLEPDEEAKLLAQLKEL